MRFQYGFEDDNIKYDNAGGAGGFVAFPRLLYRVVLRGGDKWKWMVKEEALEPMVLIGGVSCMTLSLGYVGPR